MFATTSRAIQTVARRSFSIFNGTEQSLLAVGTLNREVDGKKSTSPFTQKINVDPMLSVFSSVATVGGENPIVINDVVLVGKDGVSGVVTSVQPEDDVKESKVTFTGPAFKWTAAKLDQVTTSGLKISTAFDFDKKPSISIVVEKDGKVIEKATGGFSIVGSSDYLPVKNQVDADLAADKAKKLAAN